MEHLEKNEETKILTLEEMEDTVGGIACSRVRDIAEYLRDWDLNAYFDFQATFGRTSDGQSVGWGEYTLQCT